MAYNIPLSGQIRLGRDFNRLRKPQGPYTQQTSFNERFVRKNHKGFFRYGATNAQANHTLNGLGYRAVNPINVTANTQRNLAPYRGICHGYPLNDTSLTVDSSWNNGETWYWGQGGNVLNSTFTKFRAHETANSQSENRDVGTDVLHSEFRYASGTSNGALSAYQYLGYLEPGNYTTQGMVSFRSGSWYFVIRGYQSANLGGASTDYLLRGNNASSSWPFDYMEGGDQGGRASNFTVTASYPYVLMIIQHNTNLLSGGATTGSTQTNWLNSSIPNLDTTTHPNGTLNSNPDYLTEPHITRLS